MPWEKSFNEEAALESAMQVFWQKGFEPASIADLLKGTGLNRGSFYNAFGGKQQLFVKVLSKYDQEHRQAALAKLEALDDPLSAIVIFFDRMVAETAGDQHHKGCFLFNTALEVCTHDEKVNQIITQGIRELEAFFRRTIEVGQARKVFPEALVAEDAAKALLAMAVAIRVLGRGVFEEDALQTIANQAKKMVGVA